MSSIKPPVCGKCRGYHHTEMHGAHVEFAALQAAKKKLERSPTYYNAVTIQITEKALTEERNKYRWLESA